jgi:hypothetical protein
VPSVDIDRYYKGEYLRIGANWTTGVVTDPTVIPLSVSAAPAVACFNEDLNRNGINEAIEDINHNRSLEPRKSDVAVSILGTGKTDSSGSATVQIEYPKNVATWARVNILVAATGISGTEGRSTWTEVLPAPVAAFTATGAPAFVISPYGATIFTGTIVAPATGVTPAIIEYRYPFQSGAGPLVPSPPGSTLPPGQFPFSYPDGTTASVSTVISPCQNPD